MTKLIFITGIDGSGKTYFSEKLAEILESKNVPVKHVWARFMNYTSKPLLGICRVLKLSYRENHDGIVVGYHDFEKSRVVSLLFMIFQLIDMQLVVLFKIRLPMLLGKAVVCERGPYDTLIDIAVDIKKKMPINTFYRKMFLSFLPKDHLVFYLQRDLKKICAFRNDVSLDKNLQFRNEVYDECATIFLWERVDNNGPKQESLNTILEKMDFHGEGQKRASVAEE